MGKKVINAVIQARMGSSRLPGKVLMEIEGTAILEHIFRRLGSVNEIDRIIVATSTKEEDDDIEAFCRSRGTACIRGSEENVLSRFGLAASEYPADIYIRATGDNPMIDVRLIEDTLAFFEANDLTYTCYRDYPIGSGVEVFTHRALEEALKHAELPYELEHVTPYMYQSMPDRKVEYFVSKTNDSGIRMTIDTEQDLQFAEEMFRRLYKSNPYFGIAEIKRLLEDEPGLGSINSNVHQKTLGE